VLAKPVTVVDEVTLRRGVLRGEVDVTSIAVSGGPLLAVLMALEARGHFRQQRLGMLFRDGLVAVDAVAARRGLMIAVRESQVLVGEAGALPLVVGSVATQARTSVVRLHVASYAGRVGG
jgi:hypothetical protein